MSILERRLILVMGKGGVGRSTIAASVAAACARRGRRTLLFEFNANDRYGDFFGTPAVGSEIVRLDGNLHAVNTNPTAAIAQYGLMVLRFKRVYNMVFENRVTQYFLRAVPGLDDYAVLGKAWYHTTETRRGRPLWDTIVFDMAASGHSLSMLRIPGIILDTVPEGPLTRDARLVRDLIADRDRTAILLGTLAEEMPANEASELNDQLGSELGLSVDRVVVNQVYPDAFPKNSPQAAILDALTPLDSLPPALAAVREHSLMARQRRQLNEQYLEQLGRQIKAPIVRLPLLFSPSLGPDDIRSLSELLSTQLD